MGGPKMNESQVMAELKNLKHEMLSLNQCLREFRDNVNVKNEVIVDAALIDIGTPVHFRVPKMYQVGSLFGRLKCLAISHRLFSAKDVKAIEAKLGRKLDKFDTIYVRRPSEGGPQTLKLVRIVKLSDVVNKL